jgi:hypothetical protein
MFAVFGSAILRSAQGGEQFSPASIQSTALLFDIIYYPIAIAFGTMFYCGVYRAVLRPKEGGFAYLKFGADEWRIILLMIIFVIAAMVIFFVGIILIGLLMAALGGLGSFATLARILLFVALVCAYFWVAVRLCLVVPFTFGERKIDIGAAWRLTGGNFWRLLGMTLLIVLMWFGIILACVLVMLIPFGGMIAAMAGGHSPSFNAGAGGMMFLGLLLGLAMLVVLPTLFTVMLGAPYAEAYRQLTPRSDAAEAFT